MEKELLTVKEFAARKGVSIQSVYKRLKTSLNRYVEKVEGITMIDAAALNEEESNSTNQPTTKRNAQPKQPIQPFNNSTVEYELSALREKVAEQKNTIELLQKELDVARADIRHKDEQLEAQAARLLTITENQQELLRNSQILQAQTQKKGFFARLFAPKDNASK